MRKQVNRNKCYIGRQERKGTDLVVFFLNVHALFLFDLHSVIML